MSTPDLAAELAFRPSDYTAALLRRLHLRPVHVRGADVLEVGCGSGVLLAAAGGLGARTLTGVDIEADAVAAATRLLAARGLAERAHIHHGSMFDPLRGKSFDLVLANLPQFPMDAVAIDDRHPSWSFGGGDGRRLVGRFVAGVATHLAPAGRVVMVHNAFIDFEATRTEAARRGLSITVADTLLVPLPQPKIAVMNPAVLERESGRTIHRYGPHTFGEMLVLEMVHA